MKLKLSKKIIENYPELKIGIVIAENISNYGEITPELLQIKTKSIKNLQELYTLETLSQDTRIKDWKETYRSFGAKPKKHTPTAEAIIKRALKEGDIPTINPIVNCYLIAELDYFLPCGGYDLENVNNDIELRYSKGNEEFIPLGAKTIEKTYEGEIIYSDSLNILTRRWNYKDCDYTKITPKTKNLALFIESPTKASEIFLEDQTKRTSELIRNFCGGSVKYFVIDMSKNEYELI